MFILIKKISYIASLFLSSLVSATPLSCISLKNQACKVRPKITDINSNNPMFYPFSIKVNKCNGNCNNINDPYAKICAPDTVKDLNVRLFNHKVLFWIFFVISCGTIIYIVYHVYVNRIKYNLPY